MEMARHQDVKEALIWIKDPDYVRRLKGLRALGQMASRLAWAEREPIVQELESLVEDAQPFILWTLAIALGQIGHPRALPILERLSSHEHANVRFRAALALGLIGTKEAVPILGKLAQDAYKIGEHAPVRAFAAMALGMLHQDEATLATLERLTQDEDPVVRWHAAVSLGGVGLKEGTPALSLLSKDPVPFVRGHAAIALAQIGDPAGLPILEETLGHATEQAQRNPTPAEQKIKGVCERSLRDLKSLLSEVKP